MLLSLRRALALAAFVALTVAGAFVTPASANHTAYLDFKPFAVYFNSSLVINGSQPGTLRPVLACIGTLPSNVKTDVRTAMINDWNSTIGYQAFWARGPGEFFGSCDGTEPINVVWSSSSTCRGNWVGCNADTGNSSAAFATGEIVTINSSFSYTDNGLRAVADHELGHALGLGEQYIESTSSCNLSVQSIMNSAHANQSNQIDGVCSNKGPIVGAQNFDINNVTSATSRSFGSPPTPQIIWLYQGASTSSVRVVFKVPSVNSYTYIRQFCNGAFPTSQATTVINSDVAYADFPFIGQNSGGTAICVNLRANVTGSAGSIGVRTGRRTTSKGDVAVAWTLLMTSSSQQAIMFNASGSQNIPYTRITDSSLTLYPNCTNSLGGPDVALNALAWRECYKTTNPSGEGIWYWWSQDGSNYDNLNVVP